MRHWRMDDEVPEADEILEALWMVSATTSPGVDGMTGQMLRDDLVATNIFNRS